MHLVNAVPSVRGTDHTTTFVRSGRSPPFDEDSTFVAILYFYFTQPISRVRSRGVPILSCPIFIVVMLLVVIFVIFMFVGVIFVVVIFVVVIFVVVIFVSYFKVYLTLSCVTPG